MPAKPLVLVPDQSLRIPSKDVIVDKKTIELIESLKSTLFAKTDPKGVGLSAPQIGKNSNVFVTWLAKNPDDDPTEADLHVFINPRIVDHSKETTYGADADDPILEGCLSIPGLYGPVPRWEWVKIEYETVNSSQLPIVHSPLSIEKRIERFTDFDARVVQHEYDHLLGVLFTDYSLKMDLPVYEFVGKKMKEVNKDILKAF